MLFKPRLAVSFPLFARCYRPRSSATEKKRVNKDADIVDGIDINMQLEPVDMKKLTLPLHNFATIAPDLIANLRAKDRTLVFSPMRRHVDIVRRVERMRHEMIVQPLCRVVYLRPRRPNGNPLSPSEMEKLVLALRRLTRFIIRDERWPGEVAVEVTPYIERSGGTARGVSDVVSEALDPLLRNELHFSAHAGAGPTAVLAKMACDACARDVLSGKTPRGGIIALKEYRLETHEAVGRFVKDIPIAAIPSVGAAQADMMRDVYGITKCGEISTQAERLCFSLSTETLRFFLGVGYGLARLPEEATTTLLKKMTNFKTRQLRRESQYGRIISDEQFLETVNGVFKALYKELLAYDYVCGRVTLETRRTVPSHRWIVEEAATLPSRTSDQKLLRDTVMALAKKFAPRRTRVRLDPYSVCLHFSDVRLWSSENEKTEVEDRRTTPRKPREDYNEGIIQA